MGLESISCRETGEEDPGNKMKMRQRGKRRRGQLCFRSQWMKMEGFGRSNLCLALICLYLHPAAKTRSKVLSCTARGCQTPGTYVVITDLTAIACSIPVQLRERSSSQKKRLNLEEREQLICERSL